MRIRLRSVYRFASRALFSIVISGPPCFASSLGYPKGRHGVTQRASFLSFSGLTKSTTHLLRPRNIFSIVVPTSNGRSFLVTTAHCKLRLSRRAFVRAGPKSRPGQILLTFGFSISGYIVSSLAVRLSHRICDRRCVTLAGRFCLGV